MLGWLIFLIGSLFIIWISRKSLLAPRSHGFFRFFAWELIFGLAILNLQGWFQNWLAWHQILSWILLCLSFVPLILGIHSLRTGGKPTAEARSEPQLLGFERTTVLVTSGIFKFIRHPLYSSLLILNWGLYFKSPSVLELLLALAATAMLIATARADEQECIQVFGAQYRSYMLHTRMFIPYVF